MNEPKVPMYRKDITQVCPRLAAAACAANTNMPNEAWLSTQYMNSRQGTTRMPALNTVQFRPPKRGTAKVYGSRSAEPTRLGMATSQNFWSMVKVKPSCGRKSTATLHN